MDKVFMVADSKVKVAGITTFNKPQCQLCGKIGHVAINYYYHFDQQFHGAQGQMT